jgi:hypothetical protein
LIYSGDEEEELDAASGKDWGDLGKRNLSLEDFLIIHSF